MKKINNFSRQIKVVNSYLATNRNIFTNFYGKFKILLLLEVDWLYLGAPFSFSLVRIGRKKKKKVNFYFLDGRDSWAKRKEEGESLVSVMVKIYCPVRIHCRPFVNAANFEPILGNGDERSRISHFFGSRRHFNMLDRTQQWNSELGQERNPQIELVKCCFTWIWGGVFSTLYIVQGVPTSLE